MPGTADLALILVILILLATGVVWIYRRGKDRQSLKEHMAALEASEDARSREQAIQGAARIVREAPGPVVPDLDQLQRGPGGKTPPP